MLVPVSYTHLDVYKRQVDYIDSSGVGELVSSFTAVRNAGGELKLLSLSKKVQDVLYVTKLYTVFDIKDDEFTAVKLSLIHI